MEADLQIHCGVDYRDRWRTVDGRRVLTLRRIWVLLRHLPPQAALASALRDGKPYWSLEAHLLDDLRIATTGSKERPSKPNPNRPTGKPKRVDKRRILSGQARRAERLRLIEAGEIT